MMAEAYPLAWPAPHKRTPPHQRKRARFETSFAKARTAIFREIALHGGKSIVLSSNVELRNDGLPYASRRPPEDPAVAVYWIDGKGKQVCIPCDIWDRVEDNLWAICKTVEALRGIGRWAPAGIVDAAFSGFQALPTSKWPWWKVLGVDRNDHEAGVELEYRKLVRMYHPDRGGSTERMQEINAAYDEFKKERGL